LPGSNQIKRGPVIRFVGFVCALTLVLASAAPLIAGETEETVHPWTSKKTDVIVLVNGDRLTGEIKSLDRGKLTFSTNDMGTIRIRRGSGNITAALPRPPRRAGWQSAAMTWLTPCKSTGWCASPR